MKKLFSILKPIARGIIKSFPVGSAIVESVQNVKAAKENEDAPVGNELPHDWVSIGTQIVVWGIIIYAVVTKAVSIETVLGYLGVK